MTTASGGRTETGRGALSRSLLVVNYYSAALTGRAVESAKAASSEPLDVVIVDNSCDESEYSALLSGNYGHVVRSDKNRGYAGAINLGRPSCTGELIVIANPDVLFGRKSIDLLCNVVAETGGVAGPRFSWDDGGGWLLPPANHATIGSKLAQVLATHSSAFRSLRDRALIRERFAFWTAESSHDVETLSGAVLCVDSRLFDSVGGFDERFHLYFEENDFARQVIARGGKLTHIPTAHCRHLYNQSAGRSPDSAVNFEVSEALFFRKWFGSWSVVLMSLASSRHRPSRKIALDAPLHLDSDPSEVLVELSPLTDFSSAVGYFPLERTVEVPREIIDTFLGQHLYLRVLRRRDLKVTAEYVIQFEW